MSYDLNGQNTKTAHLLDNLRHDLRGSLIGVLGLAELLQSSVKDSDISSGLTALVSSLSACLVYQTQLIDNLIDNSSVHNIFSVKAVFDRALSLALPQSVLKNLKLTLEAPPCLLPEVIGDELRLFRVLYELMSNAIKFTSEGEVIVRFSFQDAGAQLLLCCDIIDTGVGIPVDKHEAIFQRFYRATSDQYGSGIGLSQVKEDLDAMGGAISLTSTPGVGSCFHFTVPFVLQVKSPVFEDHSTIPSSLSDVRVLLIEDHPVTAVATQSLLLSSGCYVSAVSSGEAALRQLSESQYDLVVMDLHLPDMPAHDLLNSLHNINKNMHIFGLTADAKKARDNPNFSCIPIILEKPISFFDFISAVKQIGVWCAKSR